VCHRVADRHHAQQTIDALNAGKRCLLRKTANSLGPVQYCQASRRGRQENGAISASRQRSTWRTTTIPSHQTDSRGRHRQASARAMQLLSAGDWGERMRFPTRTRLLGPISIGNDSSATPRRRRFRFPDSFNGACTGTMPADQRRNLLVHTFTPIFCMLEARLSRASDGGGGTFEFDREVPDQCNIIADYANGPTVVMTTSLSNHVPATQ